MIADRLSNLVLPQHRFEGGAEGHATPPGGRPPRCHSCHAITSTATPRHPTMNQPLASWKASVPTQASAASHQAYQLDMLTPTTASSGRRSASAVSPDEPAVAHALRAERQARPLPFDGRHAYR